MPSSPVVATLVKLMTLNALGFALLATMASAQTANIVGLGATRCRDFNGDVQQNFHIQRDYFAWAQGFMSGILMKSPAGEDEGLELNPPEFALQKQVEFLRGFCEKNPDKGFTDGVIELYRVLHGQHQSG